MIDDLHRKNRCVQIRLRKEVDTIAALKNTQLNLMYCGLGLNEPIDDIASDVLSTLTLVGEFPQVFQLLSEIKPKNYMHDVEEAIMLDGLKNVPMSSQRYLEGLECISTHVSLLIQVQNDFKENLLKCFTSPAPLFLNGKLCTMHSINPSPPTELRLGSNEGP